jgi:uncharacterized protein (TIGR00730 family)
VTRHSLSIGVFCGARDGSLDAEVEQARLLGELIGKQGHSLVYGAGSVGLMGYVARAMRATGGTIVGVIPEFLFDRERGDAAPVDTWVITRDLPSRKQEMISRADAFIALPGGFGTLDEILEVMSLNYLGEIQKPIVLLSSSGYWEGFMNAVSSIERWGFADLAPTRLHVTESAQGALQYVEAAPAGLL